LPSHLLPICIDKTHLTQTNVLIARPNKLSTGKEGDNVKLSTGREGENVKHLTGREGDDVKLSTEREKENAKLLNSLQGEKEMMLKSNYLITCVQIIKRNILLVTPKPLRS
jgi:hypothetical protein